MKYNDTTTWINATEVEITSFYGEINWGAGNSSGSYYEELNIDHLTEGPWVAFTISNDPSEAFKVGYERHISTHATQSCGAFRIIGHIPTESRYDFDDSY